MDEDAPYPWCHLVSGWFAVMHVENDDGDENGEANEEHGEKEVFAQQRDGQRSGRYNFGNEQEEHGLRQEDTDAQRHLLAGISR